MTARCCCGCGRPAVARGMANACWKRWDRTGRPASGPPPPESALASALEAVQDAMASKLDDYAAARSWRLSVAVAAKRAGISKTTAYRYERLIRDGVAA